jgi:hypothetical protein
MHTHEGMPDRRYLVTLMSDELPDPRIHQIWVDTPCTCDMWQWLTTDPEVLKGLLFTPAFMIVQRREHVAHRYHHSSSSRLP